MENSQQNNVELFNINPTQAIELITDLQKTNNQLQTKINALELLVKRAVEENKRREEIVNNLQKMLHTTGKTSEANIVSRYIKDESAKLGVQTSLFGNSDNGVFNEIELLASNQDKELNSNESKPEPEKKESVKKKPAAKKFSMTSEEMLNLNLPVDIKYIDDKEKDSICPVCGTKMEVIGENVLSRHLIFVPAEYRIEEIRKRSFVCHNCENNNLEYIYKKASPESLLPHSIVSASLLARIITSKFVNGLPIYRQEEMMVSDGIPLTRNIMTTWCMKVFENQVEALCNLLRREILKNHYIHADETRIEVLNSNGCKTPKQAYMWVYATTKWNNQSIRYFDYRNGRSGKFAEEFLKDYEGYIHTDCYGGYNNLVKSNPKKVKRCLCLVHLRRYFVKAMEGHKDKSSNNILSINAISLLDKVFKNERNYKEILPEERCRKRLEHTKPILEEFFTWCLKVKEKQLCLPKGKLEQAIDYALKGKDEFMTFLEDGNCDVSNNTVENAIRPFVIGRKNYLFHITDKGATASAGYYSIVETAKANKLDPQKYLEWIFTELPGIRPKTDLSRLEYLLPWLESVPESCRAKTMESLRTKKS